jgi:Secretion system C-terminal sorting domain
MFSKKILFGIAIIFCFSGSLTLSQQLYSVILQNGIQVDSYTYEFDIYIYSNHGEFELTSYQSSLVFNDQETNNEVSFSYINGSSQLSNIPSLGIGVKRNNEDYVLTFASLPGSDVVTQNEKKIGRFMVKSSMPFVGRDLSILWNFNGKLTTIITGANFEDITDSTCFHSYISNITDNEEVEQNLQYSLQQNYPNPFNPSTKIRFSIRRDSFVQIKVYDTLGQQVAVLVNEYRMPGVYEVNFGDRSLPSGLYIYSLIVDNKLLDTKKMILLK